MFDNSRVTITDADVAKLEKIFVTKTEFLGLKQDVRGLKKDVNGLKKDVSGLKKDVSGLKQDFLYLKQEVSELKDLVHEVIFAIQSLRDEVVTIAYRNKENTDTIANHATRITLIEDKIAF
jgi:archaellum component FlaC